MKRFFISLITILTLLQIIVAQDLIIHTPKGNNKVLLSSIDSVSFINLPDGDGLTEKLRVFNKNGLTLDYSTTEIDSISFEKRSLTEKRGFVIFRVDDNRTNTEMIPMAQLLEKYGYKMVWVFNSNMLSDDYLTGVKYFSSNGHEIVDHTPNHTTAYADLRTAEMKNKFIGRPGVSKIEGNRIYFDWVYPDLSNCIVLNDSIETIAGTSTIKLKLKGITWLDQIYTTEFGWITLKDTTTNQATALDAKSSKPVVFTKNSKEQKYKVNCKSINLTVDALKSLMLASQLNFQWIGIDYDRFWCNPGGNWAIPSPEIIKEAGISSNYFGGSLDDNTLNPVLSYNQSNTYSRWSSYPGSTVYVNSTYLSSLNWKRIVANEIAKHKGFVDIGHMWYPYPIDGPLYSGTKAEKFSQYLVNLEEMIKFCYDNEIPVVTYKEAVKALYDSLPDPSINVMPPLDHDLSGQGFPDGYTLPNSTKLVDTSSLAIDHIYSLKKTGNGSIFRISEMAGFERGNNTFSFYAKYTGNSKNLTMTLSSQKLSKTFRTIAIPLSGNSEIFKKFEFQIDIPTDCDLYTIELNVDGNENQDFYISDMYLGKQKNQ